MNRRLSCSCLCKNLNVTGFGKPVVCTRNTREETEGRNRVGESVNDSQRSCRRTVILQRSTLSSQDQCVCIITSNICSRWWREHLCTDSSFTIPCVYDRCCNTEIGNVTVCIFIIGNITTDVQQFRIVPECVNGAKEC